MTALDQCELHGNKEISEYETPNIYADLMDSGVDTRPRLFCCNYTVFCVNRFNQLLCSVEVSVATHDSAIIITQGDITNQTV